MKTLLTTKDISKRADYKIAAARSEEAQAKRRFLYRRSAVYKKQCTNTAVCTIPSTVHCEVLCTVLVLEYSVRTGTQYHVTVYSVRGTLCVYYTI